MPSTRIASRAREMNAELTHKTITAVEVLQPKSLNMELPLFQAALAGAEIDEVTYRGNGSSEPARVGCCSTSVWVEKSYCDSRLVAEHRLVVDFSDGHCYRSTSVVWLCTLCES